MYAHQVKVCRRHRLPYRLRGIPSLYRKPELAVQNPRSRLLMGMSVNARRQTQHNVLSYAPLARDGIQHFQFMKAVHHNLPDAIVQSELQLLRRLVIPMKIYGVRRHIRSPRHRKLAPRHHIQTQTLFGNDSRDRRIHERLRCVCDSAIRVARPELRPELAAHPPQGILVEHIQRGPELRRQTDHIAPANHKVVVLIHLRRKRKEAHILKAHLPTPLRCSVSYTPMLYQSETIANRARN